MTLMQQPIATLAQRLIPRVTELRERALKLEIDYQDELEKIDIAYRESTVNLLHYLAIRQIDIRQLQVDLAMLGLSSLGRMEAHTLCTLNAVLFALHRIAALSWAPDTGPPVDFSTGRRLLGEHSQALLGIPAGKRSVRIMVTMPSEAATHPGLVRDLLAAGMDVVRINCAHDDPAVWSAIINNLRRAQNELGRACKILADLAGPKLRTGAIRPVGGIIRIRCEKDVRGNMVAPAQVWLTPQEAPEPAPRTCRGRFRCRKSS